MLISVLLPTSGRFDMAMESVKAVYEKASNPNNVQVVLRFDYLDEKSLDRLKEIPKYPNLKYFIGSRYFGYRCLDAFYNELAKNSDGDYFTVWNDDVLMLTQDWDQMIFDACGPEELKIIQIKTGSQFPTITRKLYDVLGGYLALHTAIESYLEYISKTIDISVSTDIEVNHSYHKGDRVGDDNQRHSLYIRYTFNSLPTQTLIHYDCLKIKYYLETGKRL